MAIRIPKSHEKPLRELAMMDASQRKKLVEAISSSPSINSADLAATIENQVRNSLSSAASVADMLLSMYSAADQAHSDAFAEQVVEKAKELVPDNPSQVADWAAFLNDVRVLLKSESTLGVTSKVIRLRSEYAKVYCNARILTDIRPVFGVDASKPPVAGAVVHTLRITYHEKREHRDVHIAMDTADLASLEQLIRRAREKELSLKQEIEKGSMRYLTVESAQ